MIGILTPYDANNYGSKLQAYAVQEYLAGFDDVEIIRFRPSVIERIFKKLVFLAFLHRYSDKKNLGNHLDEEKQLVQKRKEAIMSFNDEYTFSPVLFGRRALRKHIKKCRCVVCGSDQIWNPALLANRTGLLEFVPAEVKKLSFSASFGINSIPDVLRARYKVKLKRFDGISVREESGLRILNEMGFRDAKLFFDPTLIVDKEKWIRLCEKSKLSIEEPYIFCYFLGNESLGRDIADKLRKQTGHKIVNIAHFKAHIERDEHFADWDLYDVKPSDFINLIRNATYVCTDSFHGTAFSIIFHKRVFTVYRHDNNDQGNTNTRIDSIVHLLDIKEVLVKNIDDFQQKKDQIINFSKTDKIIEDKRKEVYSFFSEVLHDL